MTHRCIKHYLFTEGRPNMSIIKINVLKILNLKTQPCIQGAKHYTESDLPVCEQSSTLDLGSPCALNKPTQSELTDSISHKLSVISSSSAWSFIDASPHFRSTLSKHSGLSYLLFMHPLKPSPHIGLVY